MLSFGKVAHSHKPQSKPIDIDGKWPKVSGLVLAGLSSSHHCTLHLSLSLCLSLSHSLQLPLVAGLALTRSRRHSSLSPSPPAPYSEFDWVVDSMASNSDLVRTVESLLGVSLGDSVSDSLLLIATTSAAVVIGLIVFLWKKSSDRSKEVKPVIVPKDLLMEEEDDEVDVGAGKTKVTVFFGTQTGTAEGFAKVIFLFSLLCFFLSNCWIESNWIECSGSL